MSQSWILAIPFVLLAGAALDEKGNLKLFNQGLEVPHTWAALTLEERRNLAVGWARSYEATGQALAVFFCLASGAEEQTQKILKRIRDAQAIKEVLDSFRASSAPAADPAARADLGALSVREAA
jgi:hypothetical protein